MLAILAIFNDRQSKSFSLSGKSLCDLKAAFSDWEERLRAVQGAVAYHAGKQRAEQSVIAMAIKAVDIEESKVVLHFDQHTKTGISSGVLGSEIYRLARASGHLNQNKHAPPLYFLPRDDFDSLRMHASLLKQTQALMQAQDYKGVCMLFAPFKDIRDNHMVWNNAELLYHLGLCCSKLSTTLLIKADEKKKLGIAKHYRDYCVAFLQRGAELEPNSARCATALAYRYYSNVHELMRQGERKDQDLSEQIDKALYWLTHALQIYPDSIRNHYRKGKLIIEKQVPYLTFGKHALKGEPLREMKSMGEQHLKKAIALFESLTDEDERQRNRREYTKALFVLGGHCIDEASLPLHEYYLRRIICSTKASTVSANSEKRLRCAVDYLGKCIDAETDMTKDKLDTKALAALHNEWTRSPIEKLYQLGCAHSALAFVARVREKKEDLKTHVQKAVYYLDAAAKTAMASVDRRRNTWHISEKLAWTHMHAGQYEKAAALLSRAKSGYIKNTYAIALLLCGKPEAQAKAAQALKAASADRRNLASGLSFVLLAYMQKQSAQKPVALPKTLSAKNKRLAQLLKVE